MNNGGPWLRNDGATEWYENGKLHREDGPAFMHPDGQCEWYRHGELHREDGPAIEIPIGETLKRRWFLNDRSYTFEDWLLRLPCSDEKKVMLKLQYG